MVSSSKKATKIATEQHELLEHAHRRIVQKKRLFFHLIVYLVGSLFLFVINKFLKYGEEYDWFIWAITLWTFLFVLHAINVLITKKFLGKDWERRQREKLVQLQKDRIAEIQKEIETDFPLSNINKKKS
ncbi:2TM domain-containing protein [Muriicola sp. Z0-33]|uniref:2TM domain-containing protein n=1 Tax=Muriicola sp. Z0-33 TaxID=2816957 RepID=UPI002237B032|nr:2TM domain-containing protein [Muriicola sp. Z0-33]MCW5516127.1 2TM domain-containing protein [Muriicola sp. Z0-33]